MKIAVVSNITVEPFFQESIKNALCDQHGSVSIQQINVTEFMSKEENFGISEVDLITVILNFEIISQDLSVDLSVTDYSKEQFESILSLIKCVYSKIRLNTSLPIVWFGFEDYYTNLYQTTGNTLFLNGLADMLNMSFADINDAGLSFVDTKRLVAQIGIANAFNLKNKYRWNSPYSKQMIEHICEEIYKQYLIYTGKTKKCLVLDCDNVLWGGIVSEDGIEKIQLSRSGQGRMYREFQIFVWELYRRGVILAICSKNRLSDVITVFREHSEMVLKEDFIACFAVNWSDKPSNIRKISETLNIGLDSIVFVDDSPEEVLAVKTMLPEVHVVLFHRDMDYKQFSGFNLKNCIDISIIEKRYETFRTNKQREEMKNRFESNEEYLEALNIQIDIHRAIPSEYCRIAELTQRTNKCTNGIRLTVYDINKEIEDDSFELYSVNVSDRFSDLGLVGAFAIKENSLVLFSISCRALGKEIEKKIFARIISLKKIKRIVFVPTGKNENVKKEFELFFSNVIIE